MYKPSECKSRLEFEAAIVGSFGKSSKASSAGRLIRATKWRRWYVANDRPGISVIEEIPHLRRKAQSVRPPGLTLACVRWPGTDLYCFREVRVEENCARTAAVIPVQDSLVRRWVRVKQAVGGLNQARLVWICRNARSSI